MQEGLISVIIPTYNRAHLLPETLDSLIAQSYENWECIIIDDESTDTTEKTIKTYQDLDSRIKFYKRPTNRTKGANACRNFGFEMSKGEFINWFDSDDIMLPNFLKRKMQVFNEDSSLDAVFSYGAYFNESKEFFEISKPDINYTDILDYVTNKFYLITHGPLWKKKFLNTKNLYDEDRQKIQDTEFHFRMLIDNVKFRFYNEDFLFLIRRGDERISSIKSLSTSKLEDVLKYHYFTMASSYKANSKWKDEYLEVTSRNVLKSFYEIMVYQNSFITRCKLFKKHSKKVKLAAANFGDNYSSKIKINTGILLTIFFKKGFSLLAK